MFVKISLRSTDLGLSPGGPLLGEEGLVGGFSQSLLILGLGGLVWWLLSGAWLAALSQVLF